MDEGILSAECASNPSLQLHAFTVMFLVIGVSWYNVAAVPAGPTFSLCGLWGCRPLAPLGSPTHSIWVFVLAHFLFYPLVCFGGLPSSPNRLAVGPWVLPGSPFAVFCLSCIVCSSWFSCLVSYLSPRLVSFPHQCTSLMSACCPAGNLACDV